jgi:hypothetical protein
VKCNKFYSLCEHDSMDVANTVVIYVIYHLKVLQNLESKASGANIKK